MSETIAGFPFWKLRFQEDGQAEDAAAITAFVDEVQAGNLSDLFIFSHGWNNDANMAATLYEGFFAQMRQVLDDPNLPKRRAATIGTAGIIWPSIKWPDPEVSDSAGGAASLGSDAGEMDLGGELKKVFTTPEQQQTLDELTQMLDEQQPSDEALQAFRVKLGQLVSAPDMGQATQDNLEQQVAVVNDDEWFEVLDALADQEVADDSEGGAAAFGDTFGRLWNGAKGALRVATYWKMKNRAGTVGRSGLAPLIMRLHGAAPDLRVHLLGHSFGARLVSYALAGLPEPTAGNPSPVKSLFLLQGAFSHFTFAAALPFDQNRKGDLAGMANRVDGPLLTTHSLKDLAVGSAYPLASVVARQDAADSDDLLFRWGAMGHDGAQAVNAVQAPLAPAGTAYPFETGRWLNLDGNHVIVAGGLPSGAHSDIIHPHTAWAALAAAGIG